jgi:hypothetical protein
MNFPSLILNLNRKEIGKQFHLIPGHMGRKPQARPSHTVNRPAWLGHSVEHGLAACGPHGHGPTHRDARARAARARAGATPALGARSRQPEW